MQKIQFYLLSNRIPTVVDRVGSGYITENRKVYQRKIKLYKGIDNTLEFEVRNAEQRRESVVDYEVVVKFYDAEHRELFSVVGQPIPAKQGIMTVIVTKEALEKISPQKLLAAAYLRDSSGDTILYADSQFDLFGHVEILDGFNGKLGFGEIVDRAERWNYESGLLKYVSEICRFGNKLNDDYSTNPTSSITVSATGTYTGLVKVEATNHMSTAVGVTWSDLGTWNLTTEPTKTFTGDYRFVRFSYDKFADVPNNNILTGTVDIVTIRN